MAQRGNDMQKVSVSMWKGRKMEDLTRDELLEVVEWCGQEILRLQEDRDRWFKAGDPIKYMMAGR